MSDENDPEYHALRERQARALAAAAVEPQVRKVHLDMAERYARLLEQAGSAPPARP